MKLLVLTRLINVKVQDKFTPLLDSELVEHLTLVRHAPINLNSPKLTQLIHDSGMVEGVLKQRWTAQLMNGWLSFYRGLQYARRERPQVIIGFYLVPYGVIAWLIARLTGAKAVVSLVGSDFNLQVSSRWLGPFLRAVLRRCDTVTVFGEDARARLIAYGVPADRVTTLPNTADTQRYRPNPQITPDVDLIYTGNLRDLKRVDLLLHALRLIHETRPSTTLLIVGDGAERAHLEELAQSLGVAHAVTFYGWTDQVVEQLWRARAFVFLSTYEGLPMAMIEAMCTGLPVVVTDVGAINTVVQDGENGYLIPSPANPALVAERVLQLLDDAAHYHQLREAALQVRATHGYERSKAIWNDILSRLGEGGKP
jgi:glycosyltransferase involved in cell wall biosynthesis